ncbi:MAG: tRNA (adenosine(37)-N6)-dimethylallyltransferase MiaA [Anaerolineaceae bacterium]|nr:tRNA (adenosine(37)-N6)-dimethylallyltransferase MiaA [Anaerolineaceae bacterium]
MYWNSIANPLIIIVGPTASGKTALSIELAKILKGEIISADSRYFYRGMDIGTAKPTKTEMQSIPHHLIDVAEPEETWSLAKFQTEALRIIDHIHSREMMPILVGGTGQYIHSVMHSWSMPAQERNDHLRAILEKEVIDKGRDNLYEYLKCVDPLAASQIDNRNFRRTLRAVEVILLTGHRFSDQRRISSSKYNRKLIGLKIERNELYARIDQRIEKMIENGFIEEVKDLISKGYSPINSSMSAIGYREIYQFVNGAVSLDEAIVLMKRNTRQFVRRQANWFKENDPQIQWFTHHDEMLNEIIRYIQSNDGWLAPDI